VQQSQHLSKQLLLNASNQAANYYNPQQYSSTTVQTPKGPPQQQFHLAN